MPSYPRPCPRCEAELEAQVEEHAAQVRRQKELLRSIGVPDLSPEKITGKARRPFRKRSG